ncbi:hypothetical protein [Pseudoalteromonas aurantia]|uniref:Uncharacterized protein n=2 Tax=Pseudoalteromonas TaxID=53246 RepID=A0A5S3VE40_9GAMM|nr:hypothetical protein [Pseudoalteromonas aurantia]TMO67133.1 hypothetical protein CWC18_01640 [Pseudoalteromonas aurantia]TMO70035.1 hypothetical protein CWC19_03320 [Pseudoalteromonas aurantia]TMO75903.1 hypothetical protein CWC20_06500 [Pseudoalteromonas aurantia]
MKIMIKKIKLTKSLKSILLCSYIIASHQAISAENTDGLSGYIGSYSIKESSDEAFRYGISFYSAVWPVADRLTEDLQIGMAGTWVRPDNRELLNNDPFPLCPKGTYAGDNWDAKNHGNYLSYFQTIEGGMGIWAGTRFQTGYPKFAMGSVPTCYDDYSNTTGVQPGNFSDRPHMYGLAQLSNQLLIPADGLTFKGKPNGEVFGYGYFALPFTEEKYTDVPVGNLSWTLFVNTQNFKGPVAFSIPDLWAELSKEYTAIEGLGLDNQPLLLGESGTMEFGFTRALKQKDNKGDTFYKIPQIQYPMNSDGQSTIMQDLTIYSKDALFHKFSHWQQSDQVSPTQFDANGIRKPILLDTFNDLRINDIYTSAFHDSATPTIFDDNSFGLQWHVPPENGMGLYPKYFKQQGNALLAIKENQVPSETNLINEELPAPSRNPEVYEVDSAGQELFTDYTSGPYTATLNDCSKVTYYWYKFTDQPSIKKYNLTVDEKYKLQTMVEKMHTHWKSTDEYLAPPSKGNLVSFDDNLIVTPPEGLEVGYVPIVVKQELACDLPKQIDLPWPVEDKVNTSPTKKPIVSEPLPQKSNGGAMSIWLLLLVLSIKKVHMMAATKVDKT